MRILLTAPIWTYQDESRELSGVVRNRFNFGFACLSGYLKSHGYDVTLIEPVLYRRNEYEQIVKNGNFDLIGITTWTPAILKVYDTARVIKELSPASFVVLGGVHATLLPERTLRECGHADFIIMGEGEKPLLSLAETIAKKEYRFNAVPSLVFRNGKNIVLNPRADFLKPDEFPFPDYIGGGIQNFKCNPPLFKYHPTYTLSFSRGCPLRCAFCNAYEVLGHQARFKPVDKSIEELVYLKEDLGAKGFAFQDSTFTINKRWVYEFCDTYRKKVKLPWYCITRTDMVPEDLLKIMKESGCWQIGFGFESANNETLASIDKMITVQQNVEAIRLCKKYGIRIYGSFILGWPGETHKTTMNTVRWAIRHTPNISIFNIPQPYPESRLWHLGVKDGGITQKDYDWKAYDSLGAVAEKPLYVNPRIGYKGMQGLQRLAYLKYYSSPKTLYWYFKGISSRDQFMAISSQLLAYLKLFISYAGVIIKKGQSQRCG